MTNLKEPRIRIAPSLLSADFGRLKDELAMLEEAGADLVHLDIMDGHFVPNLSFGVPVVEKIRAYCDLFFDTHVMISDPMKYAEPFIKAGSNNYTFHIEATDEPKSIIEFVHGMNCGVGVSLNPTTPAASIAEVIDEIDIVLVMSVWPGFGGQTFMAEVLPKVRELKSRLRDDQRLEIDGGISEEVVERVVRAGADTLVAGSAIFGDSDPAAAIRRMREQALAARGR